MMPTPERPVLAGPWKLIAPNPNLSHELPGDKDQRVAFERGREKEHNVAVNHHIVRADESAGESRDDWFGQEYIQSPYSLHGDAVYSLFCGRHPAWGRPMESTCPASHPPRGPTLYKSNIRY